MENYNVNYSVHLPSYSIGPDCYNEVAVCHTLLRQNGCCPRRRDRYGKSKAGAA